jgi:hypothetical protein
LIRVIHSNEDGGFYSYVVTTPFRSGWVTSRRASFRRRWLKGRMEWEGLSNLRQQVVSHALSNRTRSFQS